MTKTAGIGIAVALGIVLGAAACAPARAAETPVKTTTLSAAMPARPPVAAPAPEALPTECESESKLKGTKMCVVPRAFSKKLCAGVYPEVALKMFGKDTPWTKLWLAGDVDAWNASGGLTHRAKLAFDEEIVVLAKHGAAQTGGIVMTGSGASYDVLRADGTCVSVMEGELTARRPPKPKFANVAFRHLEEGTRHALLASPKVKASYASFEKACNMGDKKTCEKAEQSFSQAIVSAVRSDASVLPDPSRRP